MAAEPAFYDSRQLEDSWQLLPGGPDYTEGIERA